MHTGDTIVALSSAVGPAARLILRVSGPLAQPIAARFCPDAPAGSAVRATLNLDEACALPVWLYRFHSPRSYTGEDLVEVHLPGNPLLARLLMDRILHLGARSAEAGEFTARAYFNGRMDLTEAEGVAATIAASGEQELAAARQLLAGELAHRLRPSMDELADTLALVEVGIDFSDEEVTFLSTADLGQRIARVDAALQDLMAHSARFERLSHEVQFVLVGRPNAGKSTLLNALAGVQRAVVSPIAGTTRDVLSAQIPLDRGMVRLLDAAGLEENLPPSTDNSPQARIARQMHEHALQAVEAADFVVLLHDVTDPRPLLELPRRPDLILLTKGDLAAAAPLPDSAALPISAFSDWNMDRLRQRLGELAFGTVAAPGASLALNARHLQALEEARSALGRAALAVEQGGAEVVALELREALDALGRILGQITPDDVLGRVFSRFCIGK